MTNKTNKAIILLVGDSDNKNIFNSVIKENDYWVWNVNNKNYLSFVSRQYLGWDGKRTTKFYEFLDKFKDLVDEYWDYERIYTENLIHKFIKDSKTNVLVFHNVTDDVFNSFEGDDPEVFVRLTLSKTLPTNLDDDKDCIINVSSDEWQSVILTFMRKYIK